jgi:pimeloyl-ACP methyl ester carboxylesterase/sugar lactone lactonase YvrE
MEFRKTPQASHCILNFTPGISKETRPFRTFAAVLPFIVVAVSVCPPLASGQPALFTSAALGTGSTGTVTRFDLTTHQATQIATVNGFAQGMACGPDGKLYVALTGYGSGSPPRQIVRLNLDGTGQTVVLDFATTPALVNSGGPEGPSFGLDGSLYFNTLLSHGNLQATGVWRLSPGSTTPTHVILPFTSSGASGSATAFLTASPFAGDLIATDINDYKVVRVAPPFNNPQTAINLITGIPEPAGLAVDAAGNLYVSQGTNPATNVVNKYAPDGTFLGALPPLGGNLAKMTFDSAGNLYVGLVNSSGPSVMEIAPNGTATFFGNVVTSPANGVAVCPAAPMGSPKPVAVVVPGFGASTLTDANQVNQWLSCASIYSLHNNGVQGSLLPYDINGNSGGVLTPTEIFMQSDSLNDPTIKPATSSVLQCDTTSLVNDIACTTGFLNCIAAASLPRQTLQDELVSNSQGAFLQFNDPTNNLLATLTSAGFGASDGSGPVAWKYDFRRDIHALADDLYAEIQQVGSQNPGRAVAVVAHSMGGLVTAAMIAQHPDIYASGSLSKVISLGAPFAGSVDTYLYAQGWRAFAPFLSTSNTAALGQNWTSVYQLLPETPFVIPTQGAPPTITQVFTGVFDSANFPKLPRSSIVPDPNNTSSVWGEINSLGTEPFWNAIIGYGQSTNGNIVQAFTPQYLSKPCYQIQLNDGDGTVPLSSAEASAVPATRIYVSETHTQLPKNSAVISGILNILNGSSPFTVQGLSANPPQTPIIFPPDTLLINACSPIALSVTATSGNTINSQVSQIQNATYANIGSATQLTLPWDDVFQVNIEGTGSGTFDLVVNGLGGQHTPVTYSFKAVPVQKVSQGNMIVSGTSIPTLQYNYAGKNVIDTIPANTNPPTILCTGCYFTVQNVRATFAFNVGYQGGVSTFTFNYRSSTQTIQFVSSATTQISVSGNKTTFSGQGTLNGQAGYNFAVTATDGGSAGSGLDQVAINITGPNGYAFAATGTVIGGDVIVHE